MPEPQPSPTRNDHDPSNGHGGRNGNGRVEPDVRADEINVDENAYKSTKVEEKLKGKLAELDVLEHRLRDRELPDVPPAMSMDGLDELEQRHHKRAGTTGPDASTDGKGKNEKRMGAYMRYSHLAVLFAVTFGLCMGIGYLVDEKADSSPWGILIGSGLGFVSATFAVYKELARHEKL